MALVTSSNKKTTNTANSLNSANLNQLNSIFGKSEEPVKKTEAAEEIQIKSETAPVKAAAEIEIQSVTSKAVEEDKAAAKKARNYTDTVILNLPKGERAEFKSFCAKYQLTMTDFIYFAMDYIRNGVNDGKYSVSRGGIKEIANE